MSSTNSNVFKNNVVHRMGGLSIFHRAIYGLSMLLQEDSALSSIYGNIDIDGLYNIHKEILELALVVMNPEARQEALNVAILCHYRLFMLGLNKTNFEHVKKHLISALASLWIEQDVIDDIIECFEELRDDFFAFGRTCTCLDTAMQQETELGAKFQEAMIRKIAATQA